MIDSAKVSSHVDLKPEEFTEVKESMQASTGSGSLKRKVTPTRKEIDPDVKRRREASGRRNAKLRAVKSKLDAIYNELTTMLKDCSKLQEKYPQEMQRWVQSQVQETLDKLWEPTQVKLNTETVRTITDNEPVEAMQVVEQSCDRELTELNGKWSDWKKKGGAEIKKFLD